MVSNAIACHDTGMEWLNLSPGFGVQMLTAKEWAVAVCFSLGVN